MDIRAQIIKLDDLIRFIELELPVYAEKVLATDIIALVTNRVVQKGEDFKGRLFSDYSIIKTDPAQFFDKSRTAAADKRVRALDKARGALSYSGFRELNGLKVDKKNFEFTGEMWRKLGIVNRKTSSNNFIISIGGTSTASQDKIDNNSEYEGVSIIEASEKEEHLAQRAAKIWLEEQANRIINE